MNLEKEMAEELDLKAYFASIPQEHLAEIAFRLSKDCERLRRELDDRDGVIR